MVLFLGDFINIPFIITAAHLHATQFTILIRLNKLSETIETFNTLSREQAENAILETNSKINNCKEIMGKMEEYINDLKEEDENEKTELNKKLLNYKTEYNEILNKFKEIQDNYINRKTESALMDENLIDEEDNNNKNDIRMTTGSTGNNNSALGAGNPHMIDGELNEENNNKKNINNNINNKKEKENKIKETITINNVNWNSEDETYKASNYSNYKVEQTYTVEAEYDKEGYIETSEEIRSQKHSDYEYICEGNQ